MNNSVKHYSSCHYSAFRIVFGTYLFLHFIALIPTSPDIWSDQGLVADPKANFTYGIFPNVLEHVDQPFEIQMFIIFNAFLSLGIIFGYWRRTCCMLLWYGWACLLHRNNLIANPAIPFVGWLLIANTLIPIGEPLSFAKPRPTNPTWNMPSSLFYGSWLIVALSYTLSGIDKCQSPSWLDGSAIAHLLENPLARDWVIREWLIAWPPWLLSWLTWSVLTLELAFGLLCIWKRSRPWAWFMVMAMHLGILLVVNFADLSFGVMMIHLFNFDPRWFGQFPRKDVKKVVLYDGLCGMCSHSVDFLKSIDSRNLLRYSPLQGQFAAEVANADSKDLNTMIFYDDGVLYKRSEAVLRVVSQLGGMWSVAQLFLIVPRGLRDLIYGWIARNRYKFFGKKEVCSIPTAAERDKFID